MSIATILLLILWVYTVIFLVILVKDIIAHKGEVKSEKATTVVTNSVVSLIANFFDTLGIGSFAIATSAWKFTKSISDDLIPGTLNVVFAVPVVTEATIFIQRIDMDPLTLVLMIVSSAIGAMIGAKIMSKLDIMKIRLVLGIALIIVAIITLCKINAIGPFGIIGSARGLTGGMLIVGVVVNFFLGALMTAGIGLYAPCMALVLLLGMSADIAFPVMMGSCAYLMPSAGITFVKEGKYDRTSAIPMLILGVIGVLIAGFIVTSLPLTLLTYLVCIVMVICALMFFHDARKQSIK